eukprot:TRINITY_DN7219_c0_g1_i2.p1 TRINITY_DN7219_c0_g1~~TRINITY_DN7219_c0_g1_i2.p1  ORF type:complete len:763 (-),score=107.44 TRINITY_DN7219_c0_g1_i2:1216-3504(-)
MGSVLTSFENSWVGQVKCPKSILIVNWRLGLLLRVLQLTLIVGFVYVWITFGEDWTVRTTAPTAWANPWAEEDLDTLDQSRKKEAALGICTPHGARSLAYLSSDGIHRKSPEGCIEPLPGEWFERSDEGIFIPTFLKEVLREQTSGLDACKAMRDNCVGGKRTFHSLLGKARNGNDICRCDSSVENIIAGVGGLRVNVVASFEAKLKHAVEKGDTRSKDDGILSVLMAPRDHSGSLVKPSANQDLKGAATKLREALSADSLAQLGFEASTEAEQPMETSGREAFARVRENDSVGRGARRWESSRGRQSVLIEADSHFSLPQTVNQSQGREGFQSRPQLVRRMQSLSQDHEETSEVVMPEPQPTEYHGDVPPPNESVVGNTSRISYTDSLEEELEDITLNPGVPLSLTLDEWLRYAELITKKKRRVPLRNFRDRLLSESKSLLDAPNEMIVPNQLQGGYHRYPPFRLTGMEINVDLDFRNQQAHALAEWSGPVMVAKVDAISTPTSRSRTFYLDASNHESGQVRILTRYISGVSVRFTTGGRFEESNYYIGLFGFVCALLFLVQVIDRIVGAIAMYLMSYTSVYYYYTACERVRMKRSLGGSIARILGWHYLFSSFFDQRRGIAKSGGQVASTATPKDPNEIPRGADSVEAVSRDICKALKRRAFSNSTDPFARMLVNEISWNGLTPEEQAVAAGSEKNHVTAEEMSRAATLDECVTTAEFEKIYDPRRAWSFFERLFLPNEERTSYSKAYTDVQKRVKGKWF